VFMLSLFGLELPVAQISFVISLLLGVRLLWSIVRSNGL